MSVVSPISSSRPIHTLRAHSSIVGAKLIYLPPYPPDMNPIEPSFHSLKAWLRRNEERARDNDAAQPYLIFQAAASITSEMAMGWIQHSGYTFSYDM